MNFHSMTINENEIMIAFDVLNILCERHIVKLKHYFMFFNKQFDLLMLCFFGMLTYNYLVHLCLD